jgi:hypothetical protein
MPMFVGLFNFTLYCEARTWFRFSLQITKNTDQRYYSMRLKAGFDFC